GQKLDDAFEGLAGAARAARQVDDQLILPCSHNPARERRQASLLKSFRAHHLGETRNLLIDDVTRSFRSDVARCKPCASGGENSITFIAVSPSQERTPNAVSFVRQDLECLNDPSSLFQQLAHCRTGAVLP